ncbi:MAG: hypothetical protein K8R77_06110 [Anaerolineaceae bacterium]|nr:hypothetical protein [Anaerolineaceae bacterium]
MMILKRELSTYVYFGSLTLMLMFYGAALVLFGKAFDDPPVAIRLMFFPCFVGAIIAVVSNVWWEQTSPYNRHYKFNTHCIVAGVLPALILPAMLIVANLLVPNLIT